MNRMQREELRNDRMAWHDTPQQNTVKLYEQVYKGLKDAGMTSSAIIVKNAVADLLRAYPVRKHHKGEEQEEQHGGG